MAFRKLDQSTVPRGDPLPIPGGPGPRGMRGAGHLSGAKGPKNPRLGMPLRVNEVCRMGGSRLAAGSGLGSAETWRVTRVRAAGPCGRAGRGRVTGGSRAPRPGGVSRPRAATLRAGPGGAAGAEAGGGATGAGSELGSESGFESGSDRSGAGAMASSGPAQLLLLLLVLPASAARAGLHFRPGRGCYRPLRGDQLTQLGRRSGRLGGRGGAAHLPGLRALSRLGDPAASLGCQEPGRPASLDL